MVQKRNYSVDIVKLIAAYVIVFLHFPPNGFVGLIVLTISRFAVPFFFIVSGYYSYQKERASIRHIKKLIRLFVVSEILYFIVNAFQNGPVHWLHSTYTKAALWNFLLFQIPFASTHLWFLLALMLCYLFVMIFPKSLLAYPKRFYIIGLGLLIINLFLGEILSVFNYYTYSSYTRTFALMGLPFFLAGRYINEHKQSLLRRFSIMEIVKLILLSIIITLVERIFAGRVELYFGAGLMACLLMLASISYPVFALPFQKQFVALLKCSTLIYILHPLVIALLRFDHDKTYSMIESIFIPVIVCIMTTILSLFLNHMMACFCRNKEYLNQN